MANEAMWDRDDVERQRADDSGYLELVTVLYRHRHTVVTTWGTFTDWRTGDLVEFAATGLYRMHDPDEHAWHRVGGKLYNLPVTRGDLDEAHAWMVDRVRRGDVPGRW